MQKRRFSILIIAIVVLITGCRKNDSVVPVEQVLVGSKLVIAMTASQLSASLQATSLSSLLEKDVEVYKITYKTMLRDQEITASGLVVIPVGVTETIPMVSFQHGTIAAHSEAPSALSTNSTEVLLYAGLGSIGFIAVIPDFIGFGSSSDVLHPYYVEDLTAQPIMDMMKAAKEFATSRKVKFNGKLFLAGYSQGGYATMATHKALEAKPLDGFELVASFPASGGYDVKALQEYFFEQATYSEPFYLAYVALAYKTYNAGWEAPLSDFFNEPYAANIPDLFDGTENGGQINAQLTTSIADLIQSDVLVNIDAGGKYSYIAEAFTDNSLTDWAPTITMVMYHGDEDTTVPYANSLSTYEKLLDNGASAGTLTFRTIHGADHSSGVLPYVQDFVPRMISLK